MSWGKVAPSTAIVRETPAGLGLGPGIINWIGQVRLDKVEKLSCNNKYSTGSLVLKHSIRLFCF